MLAGLAASDRLLVLCGNGHASKVAGDTAGLLREQAGPLSCWWPGVDALIVSADNAMT